MPRKRFGTEHIVTTLRQAEVELGRGLHVQVVRTSADRWFRSPICTRRRAPGTPDLQVVRPLSAAGYASNDWPHPHVDLALGFFQWGSRLGRFGN